MVSTGLPGLDRLFHAEAVRAAAFAIEWWLANSDPGDMLPDSLEGTLADAVGDTHTVIELVEALARYHVTEAASCAPAVDQERLLDGAFPALGWAREPTEDEQFVVHTLLRAALVEEPEDRWGSFFAAMCELTGAAGKDTGPVAPRGCS